MQSTQNMIPPTRARVKITLVTIAIQIVEPVGAPLRVRIMTKNEVSINY